MTKYLFLAILTTGLALSGCNHKTSDSKEATETATPATEVKHVDTNTFETMLQKQAGVQLVDVRTAQEYEGGHLEDARNIDFYDPAFKSKITELDKDKPVFVYCAVGGRSAQAAQIFKDQGFSQVVDLKGGIVAWKRAGKDVKMD